MHPRRIEGMPRRVSTYPEGMGWDIVNLLSSIGAFIIAVGFLIFLYNVIKSRKNIGQADPDPWDARTIEWATSSPPPPHNFDIAPTVTQLDEWWHRKYEIGTDQKVRRREHAETFIAETTPTGIHMPSPSYWPLVLAIGLPLIGYGLMYSYWIVAVGVLVLFVGIYGFALEPSVDPDAGHDEVLEEPHEPDPEPALVGAGPESVSEDEG